MKRRRYPARPFYLRSGSTLVEFSKGLLPQLDEEVVILYLQVQTRLHDANRYELLYSALLEESYSPLVQRRVERFVGSLPRGWNYPTFKRFCRALEHAFAGNG